MPELRRYKSPSKRPLKTLERVISKAGLGSRTDARSWIGAGRVRVNGHTVQNPEHWVDLEKDDVTLDGRPVREARKEYWLLYKPAGYLTTRTDPEHRPTVYDLLKGLDSWVIPVGRLDLDTSGLLVLTNDTQFAEHLTNPEHQVPKTYHIKTASRLSEEQLEQLRQGVELADGPTRRADAKRLRDGERRTFLELVITEGRNRQVRRMIEAIGSKVLKLVRVAIGPVRIGDLQIGKYRALSDAEIRALGWRIGGQPRRSDSKDGGNGQRGKKRARVRDESAKKKAPRRVLR